MSTHKPKAVERKSPVDNYIGQHIQVITNDGRVFVGTLEGID